MLFLFKPVAMLVCGVDSDHVTSQSTPCQDHRPYLGCTAAVAVAHIGQATSGFLPFVLRWEERVLSNQRTKECQITCVAQVNQPANQPIRTNQSGPTNQPTTHQPTPVDSNWKWTAPLPLGTPFFPQDTCVLWFFTLKRSFGSPKRSAQHGLAARDLECRNSVG